LPLQQPKSELCVGINEGNTLLKLSWKSSFVRIFRKLLYFTTLPNMTSISSNLSQDLKRELSGAGELWVAVGLLNNSGLLFILDKVPKACKLNFIVGIDLPTDPKALSKLLSLKSKRIINARVLTDEFFHPKVYIIRSTGKLTAFVGSANCTMGGLKDNIEMTVGARDNGLCKSLINWFEKSLIPNSQPLTSDFIKDYKPKYDERIRRRKQEKKEIDKLKEKENLKIQANLKQKAQFISALKRIRRSKDYSMYQMARRGVVKDLRTCLDYPNFRNIDLKTFFSIKELGTIVPIRVKAKILANRRKFTALMKFLCDERISIKDRLDTSLNGKLSISNVSEGFITKVLVVHNPKKYYLHNHLFKDRLRPFGLILPRGLSFGEKYELTRDILKEIMKSTSIEDFATLDQCIWSINQ
jgi:HKD family nuclease